MLLPRRTIDIPKEIPAAVYDYYKRGVISKQFSIAPDDSYEDVLREGEEDIEDDARCLMKKLSLNPPSEEAQRQWNEEILISRAASPPTPRFSVDSTRWMQRAAHGVKGCCTAPCGCCA
jgi:hypothetical protein